MQFGPISSRSPSRASAPICSCSATPSASPVSAKPDVNSVTPPTAAAMQSRTMIGAILRGTAQTT